MESILQVEGLTGGYSLKRPVLHELAFEVKPGEIVGLIGLNGAGKSTTMKHILGLLQPHHGTIRIKGKTLGEARASYRSAYAYVPENPLLYEEMTVEEHVRFAAMAYGLDERTFASRLAAVSAEFQMTDKLNRLPGHLSKGMRQKIMIMSVFLVQPELYLIDEPFLGLDPLGIRSLLELMVERKRAGAGILLCSHILSTIEKYCDKFVLLHEGRVRVFGDMEALRLEAGMEGASLDDVFYRLVQGGVPR
jgi:ABC-2 type transport system ATP-binding protein